MNETNEIAEAYNNRLAKLDLTEQTELYALSVGCYICVPRSARSSGVTGFVKKIGRVNVTIESIYMNSMLLELKVKKNNITKYLKPKA